VVEPETAQTAYEKSRRRAAVFALLVIVVVVLCSGLAVGVFALVLNILDVTVKFGQRSG
jgi:hypothetical protein